MDTEVFFNMNEKQSSNEIKYRLSIMMLTELLNNNEITQDEFLNIRKKLLRKYKPIVGCLEAKK